MGADRFSPTTGLPNGIVIPGPSHDERMAVAVCRAKWEAADRVYKQRKSRCEENRRMLAGERSSRPSGDSRAAIMSANASFVEPTQNSGMGDTTETNLYLRTQMGLKAQAAEAHWQAQCATRGDFPDEAIEELEDFHERIACEAEVAREFSDCLDDGGTDGVMVMWYGIDRVINRKKMEGSATPISDLILAVANGVPGKDGAKIKPVPGMDYLAVADACRKFLTDPTQMVNRTLVEQQALLDFAAANDQAWVKEMESAPEGYEFGTIRARRFVYGEDILWDHRMSTRWQDARWVGFRKTFSVDEAASEESWKPSARAKLDGVEVTHADGVEPMASTLLTGDEVSSINKIVRVIEFWDRDTGEVHYFQEASTGGYDGFLERDPHYPYFDEHARSIFKDWFPMRACTPIVHNIRKPDRCLGKAWLENGKANALKYNLFCQAEVEARKRAGRVVEYPADLPDDVKAAIEQGDLVMIPRPAELDDGKPLFFVHDFGETPVDFTKGKDDALTGYAADVDMSVEEISGISTAPTLGQSEKASAGSSSRRGGLIRKLETFAGEVVRDMGQLAKRFYTVERVTALMGAKFTEQKPLLDDLGQPVMDPATNQPAKVPSMWDLFKASSGSGDFVTVTFTTRSDDLMRAKSVDDFLALAATPAGQDMSSGFPVPMFDMRPIWEKEAKARGFGRLKAAKIPPPPMPIPGAPPGPGGLPGAGGPPPPPNNGQAPGGGSATGRAAGGMRGPPPVPGRQGRGQGPGDVGDRSTTVHRTGLA